MPQNVTRVYSLPISLTYNRRQSGSMIFTTVFRAWFIYPATLRFKTTIGAAEFVVAADLTAA